MWSYCNDDVELHVRYIGGEGGERRKESKDQSCFEQVQLNR